MGSLQMEWLTYAKTASAVDGKVLAIDEKGQRLVLEWKRADILSQDLAAFKKNLSSLAAEKLSKTELAFLKANPEAASSELFLRSCKSLLESDNVDWHAIQEIIKTSVKQFYLADLSKFGPDIIKPLLDDIYFCVTTRFLDEKEPVGFLLFSITPALPFGDVKVINFFMREDNSSADLKNILMGMIFKILPQTKRIFLFARPTDLAALEMYATMGFEKDESPFQDPNHKINYQYLIPLEYKIESSKILQRTIETMKLD